MTAFQAQYRLQIRKPRSLNDATESQVLTAGSASFKVSTVSGLTGYQPYLMEEPRGRSGRIDPREKSSDTGSLTVLIRDQRTGSTNTARWATQFLGDGSGQNQLLGCLVVIEESLDCDPASPNTATWAPYWTGRVQDTQLVRQTVLALVVRDLAEDLKADVFVGRPHTSITYYAEPQLWPLGIRGNWGPLKSSVQLTGTVGTASVGSGKSVTLSDASQSHENNRITTALRDSGVHQGYAIQAGKIRPVNTNIRVRLTRRDTGVVSEWLLTAVRYTTHGDIFAPMHDQDTGYRVSEVFFSALDAGAEGAGTVPPDGTLVECAIVPYLSAPSEALPLLIDDVHPVQLVKDMLDGKWTYKTAAGAVKRTWKYNATNLNALIADTTFGKLRFAISQVEELRSFIEKEICQVTPLAYRLNASGEFEMIDMRLPQASAPTAVMITDADLVAETIPQWSQGRSGAITTMVVEYQFDQPTIAGDVPINKGAVDRSMAGLFTTATREVSKPDFGRFDLGDESFQISAKGLRVMAGERAPTTGGDQDAEDAMIGRIEGLLNEYRSPFGSGPMEAVLRCRRTAQVTGLQQGDWRLIAVSRLPDPATNARGGARLMRATEVSFQGPEIEIRFLDAGPNVVKAAPTLGVLALHSGTPNAIDVPITLNAADDWAEIQAAVTATTVTTIGSVPASAWKTRFTAAADQTAVLTGFPPGMRVWIRARSITGFSKSPGIRSSWVSPAVDHLDIAGLTAPSGLTVTNITKETARLTWTNGESAYGIVIRLVTPSSGTPTKIIAALDPGSTNFDVTHTEDGATYKASVAHYALGGGESAAVTVTWTATGDLPVAPRPIGLAVAVLP